MDARVVQKAMLLNAAEPTPPFRTKTLFYHFFLSNVISGDIPLPNANCTKELGIQLGFSFGLSLYDDAIMTKVRVMLAFLWLIFRKLVHQIVLPLYSAMMGPHLKCCT